MSLGNSALGQLPLATEPVAAGGAGTYTLTCDVGAYVYTGQAATLNRGITLSCAAGAYTYAGQAATLNRGITLACAAGAYVYVGNDATLTYVPAAGSSRLKYWDGSAWTAKTLKYWDGASWTTKPLKYWDGGSWLQ